MCHGVLGAVWICDLTGGKGKKKRARVLDACVFFGRDGLCT